jgi:hypothetical protein
LEIRTAAFTTSDVGDLNRFVADVDPALLGQIFDIARRKPDAKVEHHRRADVFGRGLEGAERGAFGYPGRSAVRPGHDKQRSLSCPFFWFCAKLEPLAGTSFMRATGVGWVGKFLAMKGRVRV